MILSHLRSAVLAAFPGLDAPKKAFFRVVKRNVARLNLQPVAAIADQTKDVSNVEVCPGVPGVTSDPTEGETCIVMFVGKDEVPYVIARAALDMPGHLPQTVRHDAVRDIKFVSKNNAKVYVGSGPTFALARAVDVSTLLTQLKAAATTMSASGVPEVVAVGGIITAALTVTITGTTKLEAE